ncbi:MAG: hypothetical protein KDC53_02085 [Saprospiraceae bacterium]|nr:hypothetical protein [Saprospiraceae bacterium]
MPASIKPKYRILTATELQQLEQEFIYFLASQSISVEEWLDYKRNQPNKVEEMIVRFSDFILSSTYQKCRLVEEVTSNGWIFYHFDDDQKEIRLVGITLDGSAAIDFRQVDRATLLNLLDAAPEGTLRVIQARKPQMADKVHEVDQMLKRGAFLSQDLTLFNQLEALASSL